MLKQIAIAITFFASGVSFDIKKICKSFHHVKLYVYIQGLVYILTPIIFRISLWLVSCFHVFDTWLIKGLIALSCMPPSLTSSVILTRLANGEVTVALMNSALGWLLGTIITPPLLLLHVGVSCTMPVWTTMVSFVGMAFVPLLVGQLLKTLSLAPKMKNACNYISYVCLMLVVLASFKEVFTQTEITVTAAEVLMTLLFVFTMQIFLMWLSIKGVSFITRKETFDKEEKLAVLFSSSCKSLTLGLPLLKALYGGYSHFSQVSLPLLLYHPVQLILGALLVPHASHWLS